jgi:predicted ester cyclase
MNIKDVAQKYMKAQTEAWLEGKVDAFDELEAPNVLYHFQPPNPDRTGLEGHKQTLVALHRALTNVKIDWKYLAGEGNLFAVSYSARGIFTGEIPGSPPPTGKEITVDEMVVCRLNKGKIVEAWMAGATTGIR